MGLGSYLPYQIELYLPLSVVRTSHVASGCATGIWRLEELYVLHLEPG